MSFFTKRTRLLIAAGVGLLVIVAVALYFLLRSGIPSSSEPPQSSIPALPAAETKENLRVDIQYTRSNTPPLAITSLSKTTLPATTDYFRPRAGDVYTIVRLTAADGSVLQEVPFAVSATLTVEDFATGEGGIVELPEALLPLIVAFPATQEPARIELRSQSGEILEQRVIEWENLPQAVASPAPEAVNPFDIPEAQAADSDRLTIAVIRDIGAPDLVPAARTMVETIEPWKTYRSSIDIVAISNSVSLPCIPFNSLHFGRSVTCNYADPRIWEATIRQLGTLPQAIIVATNVNIEGASASSPPWNTRYGYWASIQN